MRPKPPCWVNGVDCPDRCVGCHSGCEKYAAFRAEIDRINAARDKEMDSADMVNRAIYRRRHTLKHTPDGRRALAQR